MLIVQGATPGQFHSFVADYYTDHVGSDLPTVGVDDRLVRKAWKWVTAHPDVFVGTQKEGNQLTFDEVIANGVHHITASESRVWRAIAGHEPDNRRVLPLEYVLLSTIAAAGPRGIRQPDLVAKTGQDKRTVPQRTVELANKGYIEKSSVVDKGGVKTSRLRLKRYCKQPANHGYSTSSVNTNTKLPPSEELDFEDLVDRILGVLKDNQVVSKDHLLASLKAPDANADWQVYYFSQVLDRLQAIGVIERFLAQTNLKLANGSVKYVPCLRQLVEPPFKLNSTRV